MILSNSIIALSDRKVTIYLHSILDEKTVFLLNFANLMLKVPAYRHGMKRKDFNKTPHTCKLEIIMQDETMEKLCDLININDLYKYVTISDSAVNTSVIVNDVEYELPELEKIETELGQCIIEDQKTLLINNMAAFISGFPMMVWRNHELLRVNGFDHHYHHFSIKDDRKKQNLLMFEFLRQLFKSSFTRLKISYLYSMGIVSFRKPN